MKLFLRCLFILSFLFTEDLKAQSLYLPTATNFVEVGDLDVTGDQLTVEALIYYTGASVNIVSKHTNPGDVNYLLRIGSFEITTTSGFAAFSGAAASGVTISPNKMYHVAATYDGAMLKYYVNGCLTGQMPWTGTMFQSNLITAIGNMSSCQCEQYLGYIDEVRIWNVARTQTEIATNMTNLPSPTTQVGLLGYWKFDGNLINAQGNPAFDGTPVNAPLLQQAPLPYPVTLTESLTSSNPICSGEANGLINVSALGYYTPYEYSLDGTTYSASPVFPGLTAGTYTVYTRPQGNSGCAVSSTITLTDPPVLLPNLNTADVTCNGASNGTASVAPSGGDGPTYEQLWHPSLNTTTSLSGLPAGAYSVDVSDTCKASGPELVANGHFDDGLVGFTTGYTCCAGGPGNYAVDVDPNYYNGGHFGNGHGGAGNYLIVDGSTVAGTSFWCQTIPVTPNTYYSFSTFIASNYNLVLATVDVSINGTSIGSVNAPPTLFTWDPFQAVWYSGASTSATICMTDLNTIPGGNDFGIDNISFKTCLSCTVNTPFTISEPTALNLLMAQTNVSCNAGTNGSATVTASGGTPGYGYSWSTVPVQTTAAATNLAAGTYTVTVTDLNSCTATMTVTITEPAVLTAVISGQTNVACNGGTNGDATVLAGGGSGGYGYSWNTTPVQTTVTASGLSAGSYTVTVTDLNSCSATATATIIEASGLTLSLDTKSDPTCNGAADGTIFTLPSGGTTPYNFTWLPGVSTADSATGLNGGSYDITLTDANGCNALLNVVLIEPPLLTNTVSATPSSFCLGGSTTINSAVAGGTGVYNYTWNIGTGTSQLVTPLVTTNYILTVTDVNNCTAIDSILITVFQPGTINLGNDTAICSGDSILLDAGPGFVSYEWQDENLTQTLYASVTDEFYVIAIDANGCVASDTLDLLINPLPVIGLNDTLGICPGITAFLAANPGYTSYAWNSGAITSSINTTVGGNNVVTVQDANGCVNMDSTLVIVYPVPTLSFIVAPLSGCSPLDITTMNTSALNGSVIQSWNWMVGSNSSNDFDPSFTLTNSGLYNLLLTATTSNGCIVDTLLTNYIEVYPTPVAIVSPEFTEYELTDDNILITDLSQGATIYNWSLADVPLSNLADLVYPVTDTGQYIFHLIVMNQFGCVDSLDVTITVNPSYALFFPNAFSPNGNGSNDFFMPKGYGIDEFEMLIFDRWGELVFKSNDLYTGWDGTYKGGLPFADVYVYKCAIRDIKGDSHYYIGHVTVVR